MPNRMLIRGNKYRFGYQGQFAEYDPETGYNHFEARLLDTRIGRWLTTDPAGQFFSSYVSMGNNPINGVDPDGRFRRKWWANRWMKFMRIDGEIIDTGGQGKRKYAIKYIDVIKMDDSYFLSSELNEMEGSYRLDAVSLTYIYNPPKFFISGQFRFDFGAQYAFSTKIPVVGKLELVNKYRTQPFLVTKFDSADNYYGDYSGIFWKAPAKFTETEAAISTVLYGHKEEWDSSVKGYFNRGDVKSESDSYILLGTYGTKLDPNKI